MIKESLTDYLKKHALFILFALSIALAICFVLTIFAAYRTLIANGSIDYSGHISLYIYLLLAQAIVLITFVTIFLIKIGRKINDFQKCLEQKDQLIEDLSRLYTEAIETSRMKTEFFANISHELKTPLSVILGAIQLIEQSNSVPVDRRKTSKHFKVTRQNCFRLIRLINNALDITKLDSGFLKVNMVNYNIVYLIEEITQSVSPFAEQKDICLEFDTDSEEIITSVDVDKIERIILNLLSNSIKFTKRGGRISVGISSSNGFVKISVKDTGIGIPPDMRESIFERFKQVNSSLTKNFEGSGIGLSLVKSFVELHKGTIEVISEENVGSEFIITLPITLCEASEQYHMAHHETQKRIIDAITIEFSDIYSIAS